MAKARAKASVRDRAIAIWRKECDPSTPELRVEMKWPVRVRKSRSKQTITVESDVPFKPSNSITWSYAGGKLRRLGPGEAAGVKGLSACISGEYA